MPIHVRMPLFDVEFLNRVTDDLLDVEGDSLFFFLAQRLRSNRPERCEPTGSALHAHSKLCETSNIGGSFCGAKRSRIIHLVDASGVVANSDRATVLAFYLDRDFQSEGLSLDSTQLRAIIQVALQGIVDEFS